MHRLRSTHPFIKHLHQPSFSWLGPGGLGFKPAGTVQPQCVLYFRLVRAQCCNCLSLAHELQQKHERWINLTESSIFSPAPPVQGCPFLASMPAANLQLSGEDDTGSAPLFLFPVPVATCSICLTLSVCSRKDSRAWDMLQQPTGMSFWFKNIWQRMKVGSSSPPL